MAVSDYPGPYDDILRRLTELEKRVHGLEDHTTNYLDPTTVIETKQDRVARIADFILDFRARTIGKGFPGCDNEKLLKLLRSFYPNEAVLGPNIITVQTPMRKIYTELGQACNRLGYVRFRESYDRTSESDMLNGKRSVGSRIIWCMADPDRLTDPEHKDDSPDDDRASVRFKCKQLESYCTPREMRLKGDTAVQKIFKQLIDDCIEDGWSEEDVYNFYLRHSRYPLPNIDVPIVEHGSAALNNFI